MRWRAVGMAIILGALLPTISLSQGTQIALGGLAVAGDTPVEVSADRLEVNQETGSAVFSGGVTVVQGGLQLTADAVEIEYQTAASGGTTGAGIRTMHATGGVTLINGKDAAQSSEATYDLDAGALTMFGSVVLTQGAAIISGDRFAVDLETGTGQMEGNVRTVFQAQDN